MLTEQSINVIYSASFNKAINVSRMNINHVVLSRGPPLRLQILDNITRSASSNQRAHISLD